jgi:DNA repair protein RadC
MTEVQVLEFVLTFFIPRKDTNDIAHLLLDEFGSLKKVLDASPEELMKVDGIGERTAKLLTLLPDVFFYYKESGLKNKKTILKNLNDTVDFLRNILEGKTQEEFYILFLNAKQELLKFEKITTGSQNEVAISCQEIVNKASRYKPNYIILTHNHPEGTSIPSANDIKTTNKIVKMLYYHQLLILDHIIIGVDDYYSFSQHDMISEYYRNVISDNDDRLENGIFERIKASLENNTWIV